MKGKGYEEKEEEEEVEEEVEEEEWNEKEEKVTRSNGLRDEVVIQR